MVASGSSTDEPTKIDEDGHWLSCGFQPGASPATPIVAVPPSVGGPSSGTVAEVTFDDARSDVASPLAQAAATSDTVATVATTRTQACVRGCPVKRSTPSAQRSVRSDAPDGDAVPDHRSASIGPHRRRSRIGETPILGNGAKPLVFG